MRTPMDKGRGWALVSMSVGATLLGGLLLVIGTVASDTGGNDPANAVKQLMILIPGYLLLAAGYVLFVVWFGLQNRDMNEITGRRFLTTLWVVLLFVPIAHIVSLYKFADHIHDAQSARGVTGLHPVVVFLLMWLASFIGWPLAQAQMDKLG